MHVSAPKMLSEVNILRGFDCILDSEDEANIIAIGNNGS